MLDAGGVRRALARARPSAVYHCAGAPHAGQSWQTAAATLEVNVLATHHLFEAVRALGTPVPVLVPGSALVYRPSLSALDEEAAIGPNNPYATSKLAQEQLSLHVARDEGWPVFVTRSFPHIGPRQDPSFAAASFARQVARIEAGLDEPVIHVGNLEAERDLLDVRDVVRAYVALVARGRPGRVYNVVRRPRVPGGRGPGPTAGACRGACRHSAGRRPDAAERYAAGAGRRGPDPRRGRLASRDSPRPHAGGSARLLAGTAAPREALSPRPRIRRPVATISLVASSLFPAGIGRRRKRCWTELAELARIRRTGDRAEAGAGTSQPTTSAEVLMAIPPGVSNRDWQTALRQFTAGGWRIVGVHERRGHRPLSRRLLAALGRTGGATRVGRRRAGHGRAGPRGRAHRRIASGFRSTRSPQARTWATAARRRTCPAASSSI